MHRAADTHGPLQLSETTAGAGAAAADSRDAGIARREYSPLIDNLPNMKSVLLMLKF